MSLVKPSWLRLVRTSAAAGDGFEGIRSPADRLPRGHLAGTLYARGGLDGVILRSPAQS